MPKDTRVQQELQRPVDLETRLERAYGYWHNAKLAGLPGAAEKLAEIRQELGAIRRGA